MTNRSEDQARLTLAVRDGVLDLRLRVRLRWLLALLAAIATLIGSPALLEALARLAG